MVWGLSLARTLKIAALALAARSENTSSFVPLPFLRTKVYTRLSPLKRKKKGAATALLH